MRDRLRGRFDRIKKPQGNNRPDRDKDEEEGSEKDGGGGGADIKNARNRRKFLKQV